MFLRFQASSLACVLLACLDCGWVCKDVAAVGSVNTEDPRMNDYANGKTKSKQRSVSDPCS